MGYNSAEVEVLTWKDIYNSNRLQELNAQVGDFVAKNELIRSRPSWISVYANSAEQMIGALGLIFVSIGTALINYLMVGSLRLLPWKPYSN